MGKWHEVGIVDFMEVKTLAQADLKITFENLTETNFRVFDGRGGSLSFASKTHIKFDLSERWITTIDKQKEGSGLNSRLRVGSKRDIKFGLEETMLHMVGHYLGLGNSTN